MTRRQSGLWLRRALVAASATAAAVAVAPTTAVSAGAPAPKRFAVSTGVTADLRGATGEQRVLIQVRAGVAAPSGADRTALSRRLPMSVVRHYRARGDDAGLLAERNRRYRAALKGVDARARTATADVAPTVARLRRAGVRVTEIDALAGTVTGVVRAERLPRIARLPRVISVSSAATPEPLALGLADTQLAVGAHAFWDAGFLGGSGVNDVRNVTVGLQELYPVESRHPTFDGLVFQRPAGTPAFPDCAEEIRCRHATDVASVMVGRGAVGCPICTPFDANEKGTAPGVGSLAEATSVTSKGPYSPAAWLAGVTQPHTGVTDREVVLPGADPPADVVNVSLGVNTNGADDTPALQIVDRVIERFGYPMVVAAGNTPNLRAIAAPALAYNVIAAGGLFTNVGSNPLDDVLASNSSVGPTPAGRKKPDITATAATNVAEPRFATINKLWDYTAGTSFSAATVTGGAALLVGSGVTDPIAIKAVLLNSTRLGRATPSSPMGTQVGWQPDWGWGELDLRQALAERSNWATSSVPSSGVRFFRSADAVAGDRATLVWQRRGVGCGWVNCANQSFTLTNLDLTSYGPDGLRAARSDSKIDNVEQVRATASGPEVLKVAARSAVVGAEAEPFSITGTHALQAVAAPHPVVAVTTPAELPIGQPTTISATVHDDGDLGAATTVRLSLPEGVELAEGSEPIEQALGTLGPGETRTVTWTVVGRTAGPVRIDASATATAYEETFAGTGGADAQVVEAPAESQEPTSDRGIPSAPEEAPAP